MKTKILSLIFIFSILIGASSCSKDGDSISSMKADIDGNVWTASVLSVVGAKYSNYITIVGFDLTGGEQIFISTFGRDFMKLFVEMKDFYEEALKKNDNFSFALQKAKKNMIEKEILNPSL